MQICGFFLYVDIKGVCLCGCIYWGLHMWIGEGIMWICGYFVYVNVWCFCVYVRDLHMKICKFFYAWMRGRVCICRYIFVYVNRVRGCICGCWFLYMWIGGGFIYVEIVV